MYYSIPGYRDKRLPGEEIDMSELHLAPDCTDGDLSRSFTSGMVKKEHSSSLYQAPWIWIWSRMDLWPRCKNLASFEVQVIQWGDNEQSRSWQSSSLLYRIEPWFKQTCDRKSAISFESYVDDILDDAIEELAYLQPRRPSVKIDKDRKGSMLQDLLFSSIAAMGDLSDFDSDSDSEWILTV
jgi:hypothetical protein